MNNSFNVAWCQFCKQGWVEIVKDSGNDKLLLLCGECDTTCESINDVKHDNPISYEFTGSVETPSIIDVQEMGWDKSLIR